MSESSEQALSVASDEGVGGHIPSGPTNAEFPRRPAPQVDGLRRQIGVTATVSDLLDELGFATVVPAVVLKPRTGPRSVVIGQVHTLSYLPERMDLHVPRARSEAAKLAHDWVFERAQVGEVVVVEARGLGDVSVLGGMAAAAARRAGVSACIVDGGIRDLDQIDVVGLPVWSRAVTPITGKWRAEAVAVDEPVSCGGVQVRPGDYAVADASGICFVPLEVVDELFQSALAVLEKAGSNLRRYSSPSTRE